MNATPLRVGVLGAGHISEFHLRALKRQPGVVVVAIADSDLERARALGARHEVREVVSSLDELCAHGIDVVHVLTPPRTHAALALQALERGCHVYVEKPLAACPGDCDRLAEASKASGRHVAVGHSLLWDPFVRRGIELVRAGAIGDVLSMDHFRCQAPPPYVGGPLPDYYREGGFPFRDLGVHALYVSEELLGAIVSAVPQINSSGSDPNLVCDEWRVMLQAERGSASLHLSWRARPQQNVFVVHGTRGSVRIDLVAMTVTQRRTRPVPEHVNRGVNTLVESAQAASQSVANAIRVVTGRVRQYHGVQQTIAAFYERLLAGQQPAVGPAAARSVVYWTETIARQGDERRARTIAAHTAHRRTARTLVTGATGFIGRRLVDALRRRGENVRVFVRRAGPVEWAADPGIEVVLGDLGDPVSVDAVMEGVRRVFHLGGAMRGAAHDFERSTVRGTINVVDSALRHAVERLVHVSSLAVLHNAGIKRGDVIDESWPLEPRAEERGHYTRTKLEAEKYVRDASAARGLNAVIIRPAEVVDPGRALLTSSIGHRVRERLLVLGNGRLAVPVVDIQVVVEALLAAGDREYLGGRVFHLVADHSATQNELIAKYLDLTGESLKVLHVPKSIVYAAGAATQLLARCIGRQSPLSAYRLRSALVSREFDCSAAKRDLLSSVPRARPELAYEPQFAHTAAGVV